MARITSDDADTVMPPLHPNRNRLGPGQVELLRRWIDEGAIYEPHWAFIPPRRPPPPKVKRSEWVRNPIDAFLAAEQEKRGLGPGQEADRATLMRRLSLDLTGLPPTPDEVAAYVNDRSPGAYDKAVARLLASPHFGERMAVFWLDLVRYADTDGYSIDTHREIWMYRDYVIEAYNRNIPFDRFTMQQLAGDMLPRPPQDLEEWREDQAASGYNRVLMTSQEGCADPREYLPRYSADRVKNVSAVWLGLTLGCAECHDHKFDPFTSKEFYQLEAFFADIQEKGVGPQELTHLPSPEQKRRLSALENELDQLCLSEDRLSKIQAEVNNNPHRRRRLSGRSAAEIWASMMIPSLFLVFGLLLHLRRQGAAARDPGFAIRRSHLALVGVLVVLFLPFSLLQERGEGRQFQKITARLEAERKGMVKVAAERDALLEAIPSSLVSTSGPAREVRVLPRGDWMNRSGEVVSPCLPASLAADHRPRTTRLDLACWLVGPDNPLVARVLVNRLWKLTFGEGLVRGGDDFGTQGAAPTHPELLDWLAVEFVESGWDVKAFLRLLVTSSAYRQASKVEPSQRGSLQGETSEPNPDNRWLTRQNRFRLDAEFVRDQALAVSGLLSRKIGGPSVKPYQPEGFWDARYTEKTYLPSRGKDQYRRGVYTYWCRTYPHPSLQAFDAPSRQLCTAQRGRSLTPAQALVLLNDPTYGEAARALALRLLKEGGPTTSSRLHFAFQLVLSRPIRPPEEEILTRLLQKHHDEYAADRAAARRLLRVGNASTPPNVDVVELAAWTSVARALFNLQETVTRN
jgi:Protein of unknown function (DUF1553)/Protein of unknown function (DUF1549)